MFKYFNIELIKNEKKIGYAVLKYIPQEEWNNLNLIQFKKKFQDLDFEDDNEALSDMKRIEALLVDKPTIDEVEIFEEYRGKGYALELYLLALHHVKAEGFEKIYSDTYLSKSAEKMWESFVTKGYAQRLENRYIFTA